MPLITTPKLHQPACRQTGSEGGLCHAVAPRMERRRALPLLYSNPKKDKEKGLRAAKADNC